MPAITTRSQLEKNAEYGKKNSTHGIEDTLHITLALETNGIACCCVGVSALKFYGSSRIRDVWEICVPTALHSKAMEIIQLPPLSDEYISTDPISYPQPQSLLHTYDHFHKQGSMYTFTIIPADDLLLDCRPTSIIRSLRGVPYPSLKAFAQSCLDRRNDLELCEFVDATNVSEEWGEENLNLEGTHNTEWAWRMKQLASKWDEQRGKCSPRYSWPTRPKDRRLIWQAQVQTKADRLDWSRQPEFYVTQYRLHGSANPWTILSDVS